MSVEGRYMDKMDKKQRISKAVEEIRKATKKDIIFLMSEAPDWGQVDAVPSGLLGLDFSTLVGGIPRGRIIEIYGPEGSGKTSLALTIGKAFQQAGGVFVYVDMEQSLSADSILSVGVDPEAVAISQPDTGEEALNVIKHLALKDSVDLVVLDSVAALGFRAEMERDSGEQTVGLAARFISSFMRVVTPIIARRSVTLVLINQLRQKIGDRMGQRFGDRWEKETTTGGLAIRYYATMRYEVRRVANDWYIESISKEGSALGGQTVMVSVRKNKFGVNPWYSKFSLNLVYGRGFDPYSDLVEQAIKHGAISSSGSWITFGSRKFQGKLAFRSALEEDPALAQQLRKAVTSKYLERLESFRSGSGSPVVSAGVDGDDSAPEEVDYEAYPPEPEGEDLETEYE